MGFKTMKQSFLVRKTEVIFGNELSSRGSGLRGQGMESRTARISLAFVLISPRCYLLLYIHTARVRGGWSGPLIRRRRERALSQALIYSGSVSFYPEPGRRFPTGTGTPPAPGFPETQTTHGFLFAPRDCLNFLNRPHPNPFLHFSFSPFHPG